MSAKLNLREFLPYRLSVLSNTISRRIAGLYDREFGLSVWQWRCMAVLGEAPGLDATGIGKRTAMDKVAVSRAITGMVERGLVLREPSGEDGRRARLTLSPEGTAIYDRIVPLALAEEERLARVLSADERAELNRLMEKLAAAAQEGPPLW